MHSSKKANIKTSPHVYGSLSGIEVGHSWQTRQELSDSWVHRPKAAAVHAGSDGVYSILINSRYRGDDNGLTVVYAGPKPKGRTNRGLYADSLIKNFKNKAPVRIIRGAKRNSSFAPSSGFRFDGLYVVEKYWKDKGHMYFYLRRLQKQAIAPWMKRVPRRSSPPTLKTVQQNGGTSPYIAYIRCQTRTDDDIPETEKETTKKDGYRTLPKSPKTRNDSSVGQVIENISSLTQEVEIKIQSPLASPPGKNRPTDSCAVHELNGHHIRELSEASELRPSSPSEGEQNINKPILLRGGMPLPKILDAFKEEVPTNSSGVVAMETLPQQDIYEVYNQRFIYEEEQAYVTHLSTDDECWGGEEIEIDSKVIQEVGDSQIVTALSLSQNTNLPSPRQKFCETSDIEVEDGPKFGHIIGNINNSETEILPELTESKQEIFLQNVVKIDQDVDESGDQEEEGQIQVTNELPDEELKIGNVYIYPSTNCANVDEAEEAILNGNFQWYHGDQPIQDPSELTSYSLHEFQEMALRTSRAETPKEVRDENISVLGAQQLSLLAGQKPDSTSVMPVDHLTNHSNPDGSVCPYNDITLGELLAYTFNETQSGCVCRYANRLPCMSHCIKEILNARKAGLKEKEMKQIMPSQPEESEEIFGAISHVRTLTKNVWNQQAITTEENTSATEFEDCNNDDLDNNVDQAMSSHSAVEQMGGVVPQPISLTTQDDPKVTALKHIEVFWRGLEEVRDEAIKRVCNMPQPKISNNEALKLTEAESSSEETKSPEEIEEKVPGIPCFYNESKEMILHHCRKRKLGNLTVDNESAQPPIIQEVSQPANKMRMIQVRNIRTEINTCIVQMNKNHPALASPTDKETSISSIENIQEHNEDQLEEGVLEDEINSKNADNFGESAPLFCGAIEDEQNIPSSTEGTISFEQACDELCEEMHSQKRGEITTNINFPFSTVSVNALEQSSVRRRGRPRARSHSSSRHPEGNSYITLLDDDVNVFSSKAVNEQKSLVGRPSTLSLNSAATVEERNYLPENKNKEVPSSPDSDTNSFERVCAALCEELPKQEGDYSVPTPASLSRKGVSVKGTSMTLPAASAENAMLIGGESHIKKRGRPRFRLPTPPKEYSFRYSSSPEKYDPSGRPNPARNLKGFTNDDICKIRQLKEIFDLVISECRCRDHLHVRAVSSKKKSDLDKSVPLRAKSSRTKQKARRFEY